jgi:hypothetical protein
MKDSWTSFNRLKLLSSALEFGQPDPVTVSTEQTACNPENESVDARYTPKEKFAGRRESGIPGKHKNAAEYEKNRSVDDFSYIICHGEIIARYAIVGPGRDGPGKKGNVQIPKYLDIVTPKETAKPFLATDEV